MRIGLKSLPCKETKPKDNLIHDKKVIEITLNQILYEQDGFQSRKAQRPL